MPKTVIVSASQIDSAGQAASGAENDLVEVVQKCIAAHEAVLDLDDPHLRFMSELLLLAVGRTLARRLSKDEILS